MKQGKGSKGKARSGRARRQEVGFVITPGEIANRIDGLDKAIQGLAGDVRDQPSEGKLGAAWRAEWEAFRRRWAIERDSYATWDARLFATRVMPRIEAYEGNYQWWARDFAKKSGVTPSVALARPSEGAAAALVPSEVWWLLGGGLGLWILLKAGPGALARSR